MNWYRLASALLVFACGVFAVPGHPGGLSPLRITVRDCVERALRNNPDLAVSRQDREIARTEVPAAESAFLPRFTGELSVSRAESPSQSFLIGDPTLSLREYRSNVGVSDRLRIGTTLSLDFRTLRQDSNSAVVLLSPEYDTALTLSVTHPLLRDSGRKVVEAPLRVARAGEMASDADFRSRVMDLVAATRVRFFILRGASREVDVRRTALSLAERLLARTVAEVDAGTRAPVDRLPSEAAVAARREELLRAEAAARNAEDDLKLLLGMTAGEDWERPLVPQPPADRVGPPEPEDSYEEALRNRPVLAAVAARTRQAEIEEKVAGGRMVPSLALTASAGLTGLSGSPTFSTLFPGDGSSLEGNYGDSLRGMLSGKYYTGFLGFSVEIPWAFQKERADWIRARATLERQRVSAEGLRATIRAEIRKARGDLVSAIARMEASTLSVAAAKAALDAEERRRDLGGSTSIQVLRFQQEYSEALHSQARAEEDAYSAQTRLWRAAGTILDREGVSVP